MQAVFKEPFKITEYSFKKWSIEQVDPLYGDDEGVNPSMDVVLHRCQKVADLKNLSKLRGFVLVRSPPMTGKTSLAWLIRQQLKTDQTTNILFTCKPRESFGDSFSQRVGISISELMKLSEKCYRRGEGPTVLIIDEAQLLFKKQNVDGTLYEGGGNELWNLLKTIQSEKHLQLLCFAAYGEFDSKHPNLSSGYNVSPPAQNADQKLGLDFMMFSNEETLEFCKKYCEAHWQAISPENMIHLAYIIEDRCGRHPGLFTAALKQLRAMYFRTPPEKMTLNNIAKSCYGMELTNFLFSQRAVKCVSILTHEESLFCCKILQSGGSIQTFSQEEVDRNMLANLVRKFVLVDDGNQLIVPCGIMKEALLQHLYGKHIPPKFKNDSDFATFVKSVISLLDVNQLKNSLSRSRDDTLLERAWQFVFYQAVYQLCGNCCIISPDAGRFCGSRGFIDFFIDGNLGWAIELLRDGDGRDIRRHLERFDPGGTYASIVEECTHWLVIDLRALESGSADTAIQNRPHLTTVQLAADWQSATITINGVSETIALAHSSLLTINDTRKY